MPFVGWGLGSPHTCTARVFKRLHLWISSTVFLKEHSAAQLSFTLCEFLADLINQYVRRRRSSSCSGQWLRNVQSRIRRRRCPSRRVPLHRWTPQASGKWFCSVLVCDRCKTSKLCIVKLSTANKNWKHYWIGLFEPLRYKTISNILIIEKHWISWFSICKEVKSLLFKIELKRNLTESE